MPTFISFDTETTGLKRLSNSIFSFSEGFESGDAKIFRMDKSEVGRVNGLSEMERLFSLTNGTEIIMHNCKFDLGFVEHSLGKKCRKVPIHDTMIMSHILQNTHPTHALKDLSWEFGRFPKDDEDNVKRFTKGGFGFDSVPVELMNKYQTRDALRTMFLFTIFYPKIVENQDFLEIYSNEVDVAKTTIDIEDAGVMIRRDAAQNLILKLRKDAELARHRLCEINGSEILPGNPSHVAHLLFQKLGLPKSPKTTAGGKETTDKGWLLELRRLYPHEAIDLIMKYRSYTHGSSIIESYLEEADSSDTIHPDIRTLGAATGRESCTRPNLQNVEKEGVLNNPFPVAARTIFRPRPGCVNFHIDYSGIEMRLLVHYSEDELLLRIFSEGGDAHSVAAELFYGDNYRNADAPRKKTLRGAAKNANFAIGYGASPPKVAEVLSLPVDRVNEIFKEYRKRCPRFFEYGYKTIAECRSLGYTTTTFGRILKTGRGNEHKAPNYRIQGTAAEILKRGQVKVHSFLEGTGLRILLPIHDELIIECPRKRLCDAKEILRECAKLMTDFGDKFRVPMSVEVEVATSDWQHKEKFPLEDKKEIKT